MREEQFHEDPSHWHRLHGGHEGAHDGRGARRAEARPRRTQAVVHVDREPRPRAFRQKSPAARSHYRTATELACRTGNSIRPGEVQPVAHAENYGTLRPDRTP